MRNRPRRQGDGFIKVLTPGRLVVSSLLARLTILAPKNELQISFVIDIAITSQVVRATPSSAVFPAGREQGGLAGDA
jgi:hypothetical protein